jgi:hypothetical protein
VHWPVIEGRWFFDGGRIRFDRRWQEHAIRPVDRRGCLAGDHPDAHESETSERMQSGALPCRRLLDDGGIVRFGLMASN